MTKPAVPTDLSPEHLEDFRTRDKAYRMADALSFYAHWRALAAKYPPQADGFRADAKAALHAFPDLLALVEGDR